MRRLLAAALVLGCTLAAQQGTRNSDPVGPPSSSSKKLSPHSIGKNGWPTSLPKPSPAPAAEVAPRTRTKQAGRSAPAAARSTDTLLAAGTRDEPLASGMHLDSPLHDVFRATRAPGAMRAVGGVVLFWKLTVHGEDGAAIGERNYVHVADLSTPGRDRLEYGSRVFVQSAGRVAAGQDGIPWDQLQAAATAELELFGLHARFPWCYGDGRRFAILRREVADRRGERLNKLTIERRPAAAEDVFGPEQTPRPRDRFELLYEPTTGTPRELVHRFAGNGQQRRVLLEDWREFAGVRLPHRRVYVDDKLRPTTTLQLMDIRRRRVGDEDFRLL